MPLPDFVLDTYCQICKAWKKCRLVDDGRALCAKCRKANGDDE